MGYHFEIDGLDATVHPEFGETEIGLRIDGIPYRVSLASLAPLASGTERGEAILEFDGQRERVWLASRGDVHFVHLRGRTHRVVAINALERARQEAAPSGGAEILRAPMPGVVVRVAVEPGADVSRGQLLMTIESMKLETAITAPHDARIAEVCVSAGASFDQDATLIRLEAENDDEPDGLAKENSK
jgi:biotin carboxyl carrier protein